jgi:hypothetical protein
MILDFECVKILKNIRLLLVDHFVRAILSYLGKIVISGVLQVNNPLSIRAGMS